MTPEERRQRLAELRARKAELESFTSPPTAPAGVKRGGVVVEAPAGLSHRERSDFYRNAAKEAKQTSAEEAFALAGVNSASLGNAEGILASQERAGGVLAPMTGGQFKASSLMDFANPLGPSGAVLAPFMRDRVKATFDKDFNQENEARQEELRQRRVLSREEHPGAALAGDALGYITPGGVMLKGGSAATRAAGNKLVSPAVRRAFTPAGNSMAAKGTRYTTGVLAPSAAASAADFGVFNATVAGSDIEDASLADRARLFREGATDPLAWAAGPAASVIYRGGRGAVTAARASRDASKDAGRLVIKKGSFTPEARADQVEAYLATLPGSETPRQKALRMVYKRLKQQGMTTDDVREAIKNASYGGYSSVDEMLFELAGASNDQLAVALGSVGGEAKKIARERLTERSAGAPARIRKDLRAAMGLEGDDFYQLKGELKEKRLNEPKPLYDEAYGKAISEETWNDQILPILRDRPSARAALDDAIAYANDLGELPVARQLDELRGALDSPEARPPVLSTQALDYVDRMLGDMAEGIRKGSGRKELARGPATAQSDIRGSGGQGLDPETGLNVPRSRVAELKSAEEALDFGRTAFRNGTDLETLTNEFDAVARRYGADGAKSEDIQSALLMGWLRGAEDAVEKATNPGTVIRQIYGSERQRNKLLEMLPSGEGLSSGSKSDLTKRIRALVGDEKSGRKGRIEREREFFDNQSRIIRNSPSAERLEAISEQGGAQDKVQQLISAVFAPREAAKKLTQAAANRVTRPGIYNPEVNRELGDIMFSSGAKGLRGIADEIDSLPRIGGPRQGQLPRGGQGALPDKTSQPPGGPVAAGGFAGFGNRRPVGFHDDVPRGTESFSDPRLTPTENKAVEMAKNGYSNAEIAEELMLNELNGASVVLAKARAKGVDVPAAVTGRPPETRERILELARRGARPAAIAEMTGKSVNTVKVTLSKARKAMRDAGEEVPDWLKPRTDLSGMRFSGLQAAKNDAGNALVGGAVGGMHPDFDGDGEVTPEERLKGIAIGAGGMAVAGRLDRTLAGRAGAASAGVGGKPPKPRNVRRDVPLGTKKRTDMPSLKGSIQKALDGASGMGAARATGDPRVVRTQAQNEAAEMLAAGARPADVHKRTGMVAIDTGEGSAFVYAPKNSIQEVQAAFWQEMAKPYSARQKWAQVAVGRTPPVGPGTVTGKPFETRAARAEEMLSSQKSPERIFEETGTIAIYRTDGRKLGNVGQNGAVAGSAKPAAVIDGSEFETYADAYKHLREIASKPLSEQPKWFREAVTDVPVTLDKSLSKPEVFLRKYGKTAARVTMPPAAMIGGAALAREVEKRREEARAQSSR